MNQPSKPAFELSILQLLGTCRSALVIRSPAGAQPDRTLGGDPAFSRACVPSSFVPIRRFFATGAVVWRSRNKHRLPYRKRKWWCAEGLIDTIEGQTGAGDVSMRIDPIELSRELISFNTINPPGNELSCILHLERILSGAGLETSLQEFAPGRANLIARVGVVGSKLPLCFTGHVARCHCLRLFHGTT